MTTSVEFPASLCRVGVARGDITPPVGIYHRMWGAATHDRATGVHRPLTATVLILAPARSVENASELLVLIAIDHCLFWNEEMNRLLDAVSTQADVPRTSIVVWFSHTHGAGLMGLERAHLPGGELIPTYLEDLQQKLVHLTREARSQLESAFISYTAARCDLARNRDYFDSQQQQFVCGYNPDGEADDTVLVARITDSAGRTLATLVNYACHPTTLAWENTQISPDYVGALRELVEQTTQAPCFFVQGASGDVGPREGFVGDVRVADRHGRQLGYAVLGALESMPPPETRYAYAGPVVSGATLGTWKYEPLGEARREQLRRFQQYRSTVPLTYRSDLPTLEGLEQEKQHWQAVEDQARQAGDSLRAREARAMVERAVRRLTRTKHLPPGPAYPFPLLLWRVGDAIWIALEGEHYNVLQRALRERFPRVPLVIGTLANGSNVWYLPTQSSYGKGLYQEDASVVASGSLEKLMEQISAAIDEVMAS